MSDLAEMLRLIASGDITLDEAARRMGWPVAVPERACLTCAFCRRKSLKPSERWQAGQHGVCVHSEPHHVVHVQSVACSNYEKHDPRHTAPLVTRRPGQSRMFK